MTLAEGKKKQTDVMHDDQEKDGCCYHRRGDNARVLDLSERSKPKSKTFGGGATVAPHRNYCHRITNTNGVTLWIMVCFFFLVRW
jgi:hypothetical protein